MRCNEVHEAAWRRPGATHVGRDERKRRSHSETLGRVQLGWEPIGTN